MKPHLPLAAALLISLSACSILPNHGPEMGKLSEAEKQQDASAYEVIDVDAASLKAMQLYKPSRFSERFTDMSPPARQVVSLGDQISVTIWEAASGGLFTDAVPGTSGGAHATALPVQQVGSDGTITVPYVGAIPAAGRAPEELSREIEDRLQNKAIKPQALVTITTNEGAFASVVGDVTGAARVPLSVRGDRLLDVIASAGGIKAMPFETRVRLTRGNQTETVSLDTILHVPEANVYVQPNDQIYVYRAPESYVALGAVTAQKEYPIDADKISLAQAVAKAGGLVDTQADASAIFLFRYEDPAVVRALHPASRFLSGQTPKPVPVIYRIDFGKPESYFLAQAMDIRDQDLVYVADASSVQFNKFLTILRNVAGIYGGLRINSLITN